MAGGKISKPCENCKQQIPSVKSMEIHFTESKHSKINFNDVERDICPEDLFNSKLIFYFLY